MKKSIAVATTTLLTLGTFSSAMAATDTDTLFLQGEVAETTEITVTDKAAAQTLDILNGESDLSVATADEFSNSLNGYEIKMYSDNAGALQNSSNNSISTSYQIKYGANSYQTPGTSSSPVTILSETGTGSAISNTRDVKVNVTAFPGAVVGTYEDTVTFVIESL